MLEVRCHSTRAVYISRSGTSLKRSGIFKTELVIHSVPQFLFAAEVTFRGLNRSVSEQKLDLLQFTACEVAKTGRYASGHEARGFGCQHAGLPPSQHARLLLV